MSWACGLVQAQHIIGNIIIPIQVNNDYKLGMKTTLCRILQYKGNELSIPHVK
jgi:hypothetical protein